MARSRFHKEYTDEERAEFKRKRLERKSKLTMAFQLGWYVGEDIVYRFLPTLSVDMLKTRTNISVTCGEGDECRRLNDLWFAQSMRDRDSGGAGDSDEWKALRAYHEMLEAKYLKDTIECCFQVLNIQEKDMDDFKAGIGASLWDCDCSHYSTKSEDIDVRADEDGWFTVITLKRSKD